MTVGHSVSLTATAAGRWAIFEEQPTALHISISSLNAIVQPMYIDVMFYMTDLREVNIAPHSTDELISDEKLRHEQQQQLARRDVDWFSGDVSRVPRMHLVCQLQANIR